MIKGLAIKNFRSIREATLELGKFTVLNGANNSGKSSVLYALQVLQNTLYNSNQQIDEFFNLKFVNLGGLQECSFNKQSRNNIELEIEIKKGKYECSFKVAFNLHEGHSFTINGKKPYSFHNRVMVTFPYSQNKVQKIKVQDYPDVDLSWNGIRPNQITANAAGAGIIPSLTEEMIAPLESVIRLDLIPTKRGFTKTIFNEKPIRDLVYEEEEVASMILKDSTLEEMISFYFHKITGLKFSLRKVPQAGFFFLNISENNSAFGTEVVNQGMGINQIVFMLAKILYDKNRLICIDEPEIHLHPTLIEQFVKVLVEIAEKEDKQFIFSTHSEHWMMSLLAEVYEKNLAAEDLKVYYLQKENQETIVESQKVHPNGQIEGGLKNFMEAQMRLANRFFPAETTV